MGVNLGKGERVSLAKKGGQGLTKISMGLGWDVAQPKGFLKRLSAPKEIDLDASCLIFDAGHGLVDQVWFSQLDSADGSVHHTGDNRTGAGEGDDETIEVDLTRVPAGIQTLVFVVNSFTGQSFEHIANAYCRVVDLTSNTETARYNLSGQGSHTAQIMAQVYRDPAGGWVMQAIGHNCSGSTFHELLPAVVPYLGQ